MIDLEKLNSHGLSMAQVRDAIASENIGIPGGVVEQGKAQLLLRTLGRLDAAADFGNITIATMNGTPIRVSDVGYAEDGFERPTLRRLAGKDPAVMLDVRRAMGENTVTVTEGRSQAGWRRSRRSLPKDVAVTLTRDDSRFIYASVASLEEHLLFGSLFAAVYRHGVHPQHPGRPHRLRWRSRPRSSRRSR